MIRILIADDQELMRQSIKMMLDGEDDFEVTDAVSNGTEVIRSVREKKPDIVLMDVRMPKMDGVVCTKIIKENCPEIKVIILTTFDDDEYVSFELTELVNNTTILCEGTITSKEIYGRTIKNEFKPLKDYSESELDNMGRLYYRCTLRLDGTCFKGE